MILEIKLFLLLVITFIAAYTDYKTGYIYDYITYTLIILGIILSILDSTIFYSLISILLIFLIFYPLYYFGKIGGGDVKLFMGISAIIPVYDSYPFIIFVIFISSLLGAMFYGIKSIYLLTINKKDNYYISVIISIVISILFSYSLKNNIYLSILGFAFSYICVFNLLNRNYIAEINAKEVNLYELLDDDIVDLSFMGKNYTIALEKKTYDEIMSKYPKELKVKVYRDLPIFGPSIFVAVVISLFLIPYFANITKFIF